MAQDKNNRFNLNKSSDRKFDLSKDTKRKFDLSKDTDEEVVAAPATNTTSESPASPTQSTEPNSGGNKKWLWVVIALAVIALLVWLLKPSNKPSEVSTQDSVEAVASPDTVATDDETSADSTVSLPQADDEVAVEEAASQPATPEVTNPSATSAPTASANAISSSNIAGDIEAEAQKVIRGVYGVGQERKSKLGTQYSAIQKRVNQLKREGAF